MAARAGLSRASFGAAARSRIQERLRTDMARRDGLGRQARSALDGIVHALKPEGMDPHLPARHLLDYVLDGPDGPRAVVAAGDPATATHLTWLVSGMGIRPHTAMWGTAREAAQLAAAQRAAGAPRPAVLAWLGYAAPTPWRVLLDGPGRRGGERLADDVAAWWDFARTGAGETEDRAGEPDDDRPSLRARGTALHGAVEAHSYGSLVAAHALRLLAERGLQPDDVEVLDDTDGGADGDAEAGAEAGAAATARHAARPAERPVEALVVSGAVGLPAALAARAGRLGLPPGRVFRAQAPGDVLARVGRALGRRRDWTDAILLPVTPRPGLEGAAVHGHRTARWSPAAGADAPRGYRDPGTVTLAATARVTAGLPLPPEPA